MTRVTCLEFECKSKSQDTINFIHHQVYLPLRKDTRLAIHHEWQKSQAQLPKSSICPWDVHDNKRWAACVWNHFGPEAFWGSLSFYNMLVPYSLLDMCLTPIVQRSSISLITGYSINHLNNKVQVLNQNMAFIMDLVFSYRFLDLLL